MRNHLLDFKFNRTVLSFAGIISVLLGAIVLLAWATQSMVILQIISSSPPMMPNTAVCFVLLGLSILFLLRAAKTASIVLAGIVLGISVLVLTQYFFALDLGIDQLLFSSYLDKQVDYPGRIAPNTAVCFFFLGMSLLASNLRMTYRLSIFSEIFSATSAAVAIVTIIGYSLGLSSITGWFSFTGMAIHTAIGLIVVSLSLFTAHCVNSYYIQKNFFGPLLAIILITVYITIVLLEGFHKYENVVSYTRAKNSADFIAYALRQNLQDIAEASNRMIQHWEMHGDFDLDLWRIDSANLITDYSSIRNIYWYDKQFKPMYAAVEASKPQDNLFTNVFSLIQTGVPENRIYHKEIGNNLFFILPLFSKEGVFQGVQVTDVDLESLYDYSITPYVRNYYEIEVGNTNQINFRKIEKGNGAISAVDSPFLKRDIAVIPKKSLSISTYVPGLIIICGGIVILSILAGWYLIRQILRGKEKALSLYRDKENSLAFRQAILDASSYSIIAVDKKGTIQTFNKAAERMLQLQSKDMISKQSPVIFHDMSEIEKRARELTAQLGEKIEPGIEVFVAKAKRNQPEENEWTYIRQDGSRFPVHLSISAVKNHNGDIIGFVGIAYDLTQIKELERMKNELIAVTTHEIRSPLTSIKGALDLIDASDKKNHIDNPLLQIARNNCDRLLRLSNDILDLQKMESGKMVFYPKEFSVEDIFNKVIEINTIYALTHDVRLVHPDHVPDCIIYADEDRILQVLTNFVSNAIKNSPKDAEISFEAKVVNNRIRFGVRDHGSGIPKEYQDLIFKKFSQVPSVSKARDGSGLGLSICKSIVKEHGGTIGFDTSPQGTVFWFEIPLRQSQKSEEKLAEQPLRVGEANEDSK